MGEVGAWGCVTWKECSWPFLHFTCWEKELNLKKKCVWKVLSVLFLRVFQSLPQRSFTHSQVNISELLLSNECIQHLLAFCCAVFGN